MLSCMIHLASIIFQDLETSITYDIMINQICKSKESNVGV